MLKVELMPNEEKGEEEGEEVGEEVEREEKEGRGGRSKRGGGDNIAR